MPEKQTIGHMRMHFGLCALRRHAIVTGVVFALGINVSGEGDPIPIRGPNGITAGAG